MNVTKHLDIISVFAEGKNILFSKYLNMADMSVGMFKCYGNKEGLQSYIAGDSLQLRKESWKLKDDIIKVVFEKKAFGDSSQDNGRQGCSRNRGGQGGGCNDSRL